MNGAMPTIEDVARLAGVSRTTVSRVINGLPGASAPVRRRVQQAVMQLGYRPNETARALGSGRRRSKRDAVNGARPTIEDVARLARVSRTTVSRVINDLPGASAPVRCRVQQAVVQLGYRPNETARALASGRRRTVDLMAAEHHPDLSVGVHAYRRRVLSGAMTTLQGAEVQLGIHVLARKATAADSAVGTLPDQQMGRMASGGHRQPQGKFVGAVDA